jgi:PKD repeat protein
MSKYGLPFLAAAMLATAVSAAHAASPWGVDNDRHEQEEHEALRAVPYASSGSCGVERWSVKTGTDPDAGLVDLAHPVSQTIAYLDGLTPPATLPANGRVQPTETTEFVVNATLVEYKLESDSDYHLVLKDAQGNTMIAEIPDPACVGAGSPFAAGIQNARSEFDSKYAVTTSFTTVNIPVQVTGVGFFDFDHGQTGVAPNAVELHPVLDIIFNPSTGGDVPPVASFTSGANGLTVAFINASSDSDGTVTGSSWNFGDGSTSTATSPSHTYAAAGTYTVTLTVTDNGGKTATKTASITVGATQQQLLDNAGFESGTASPWTMSSGTLCSNSSCSGETAHSGSWFAWLDGYGSSHTDTVSQQVAIPSGMSSATLTFYLHVDTAETTTSTAYDTLKVQVVNASGSTKTLATYSNLNQGTGYVMKTLDLTSYVGQSITLKFVGTEDSSLQTSFVLDDAALTVR